MSAVREGVAITDKYLSYVLGGGEYATRIDCVREIIARQSVTPLPRLPAHVLGVTNLRGRIIPVVDLRLRLGLPVRDADRAACIIITELPVEGEAGRSPVGFLVDAVREVLEIPASCIDAPPQILGDARRGLLHGLAQVSGDGSVLGLLDLRHALGDGEAEELADVSAPGPAR